MMGRSDVLIRPLNRESDMTQRHRTASGPWWILLLLCSIPYSPESVDIGPLSRCVKRLIESPRAELLCTACYQSTRTIVA